MEGDGHNPVCRVKGFLDAVAMMDVDVNVQYPLVILEQLQDGQYYVIDITEARCFRLLGVVEATSPVDGNIRRLLVQLHRRGNAAPARELAELVKPVKDGTILPHIESLHLLVIFAHVIWANGPQEANVVIGVKLGHFLLGGLVWPVDFHLPIQSIVEQKIVGHANAVRFHRMSLAIIIVADVA